MRVSGADLLAAARAYLGVPYLYGGKTSAGLDCSQSSGRVAKLDPGRVHAIRASAARGRSQRSLVSQFGVHPSTISNIISGRTWRHVA